jgi:hypothetical protein
MTVHLKLALGTLAVLALAGCGDSEIRTGPQRSEIRTVSEFQSVEVGGATRLELEIGSPAKLEVEGRDPFLENLVTEVRGGTLHIESRRHDWLALGTMPRITVRITTPKLNELKLQGGNDVDLRGFNGGATQIRIQGAANLDASGRLDELKVFMAGAGHADFSQLSASSVNVTVAGVGSVFVHPQDKLDATMNGVGAIFYSGSPREVNTHVNGLGTIGQRNADEKVPDAKPPIDPDQLQPEYEEGEQRKPLTEVI